MFQDVFGPYHKTQKRLSKMTRDRVPLDDYQNCRENRKKLDNT